MGLAWILKIWRIGSRISLTNHPYSSEPNQPQSTQLTKMHMPTVGLVQLEKQMEKPALKILSVSMDRYVIRCRRYVADKAKSRSRKLKTTKDRMKTSWEVLTRTSTTLQSYKIYVT